MFTDLYGHFLETGFLSSLQDEICKSIAENGGIDALLRCIDDSGEQGNSTVAIVCCSLLSKVKVVIAFYKPIVTLSIF